MKKTCGNCHHFEHPELPSSIKGRCGCAVPMWASSDVYVEKDKDASICPMFGFGILVAETADERKERLEHTKRWLNTVSGNQDNKKPLANPNSGVLKGVFDGPEENVEGD